VWYADADGDGFGDPKTAAVRCEALAGEVENGEDCADDDAAIHPAAGEVCDGVDQDCDGLVDNAAVDAVPWFLDLDEDGFGSLKAGVACAPPPNGVLEGGDCNDGNRSIHPGARERACDRTDSDCDGVGAAPAAAWHSEVPTLPEFSTVQAAIDAAPEGGKVVVCRGTWTESLVWSKSLQLRGDTEGSSQIRANGGRTLEATGSRITLRNLVLTGGVAKEHGGIAAIGSERLTVEDVIFEGGSAGYQGGGLAWGAVDAASALVIRNAQFRNNEAGYGGGGLLTGGRSGYTVELDGVTFEDNAAENDGGGASMTTSSRDEADLVEVTVRNSRFLRNEAGYQGGGLDVGGWTRTTVNIEDTTFQDNVAGYGGGGTSIGGWKPTTAVWTRVTYDGNAAPYGAALSLGSWADDTWTFDTCTIQLNAEGPAVRVQSYGTQHTTFTGGAVIENEAGIQVDREDLLVLEGVDLGAGITDNTSFDVRWGTTDLGRDGVSSLACDSSGCR
jgi:hypothetical protein